MAQFLSSVITPAFQSNVREECAICCEALPDRPCAFLSDEHGRRCCRHFFHADCANRLVNSSHHDESCPLCRQRFKASQPMPDIKTSPDEWFKAVDFDSSVLLRDDVLDALGAVLQVDVAKLDCALDAGLWSEWDPDMSGITLEEFNDPVNGLLQWVLRKMPAMEVDVQAYPDIFDGELAWFDFWDTQKKGCLTKSEVLNAIAKSYSLELDEVETMHLVLDHCWDICSLTEVVTRSSFYGSVFTDALTSHLQELWGPGIRRRITSAQAGESRPDKKKKKRAALQDTGVCAGASAAAGAVHLDRPGLQRERELNRMDERAAHVGNALREHRAASRAMMARRARAEPRAELMEF